MLTGHFAGARC